MAMSLEQANYCGNLKAGNIEVAAFGVMAESIKELMKCSWRLSEEINPSHIAMIKPKSAYSDTKAAVDGAIMEVMDNEL